MRLWKILRKEVVRLDADNVELHLHVERDGVKRNAVVSGSTYERVKAGDEVELSEVR
jgi:hypothetical protein